MRIIYLHQYFKLPDESGGTRSYDLASGFLNLGHQIEIVTSTLLEIEFEREGEIEINFVPIRTGVFPFEIEGLQSKGMVGEFVIK